MYKSPISTFDYDQEPMNVSVYLNNKPLDENIFIQHLSVNSSVNLPAKAVLTLVTEKDIDNADFTEGKNVIVKLGYGSNPQSVFEGLILQKAITDNTSGGTTIKLLCISTAAIIKMEAPYTKQLIDLPGPFLKLTPGTDIIDYTITACQKPDLYNPDWFCGRFSFPGSVLAAIHTLIRIDKELQPHRQQDPYIASVEHVLENGTWVTSVTLGKPDPIIMLTS